jgi:hypothetical protein
MPESHKAEKRRMQKANRAAGIGDESGRIVRVKDAPIMLKCSVCMFELKVTKTNAELKAHSEGKHSKPLEECFPGCVELQAELIAKAGMKGGQHESSNDGPTKKEKKSKDAAGLDDMLSAGLSKKKGKK